MSDQKQNSGDFEDGKDDVLESLFRHIPARQQPPVEYEAEIRKSLHGEWKALTRRRMWRKASVGFALAATVVMGVYLSLVMLPGSKDLTGTALMANVEIQRGEVWISTSDSAKSRVALAGQPLHTGQIITTTQNGLLSLHWMNGESIRLDSNSSLKLVSDTGLELLTGQIYIDSGSDSQLQPNEVLILDTPEGQVRHIGTRYMTTVNPRGVSVSVREGSVAITRGKKDTLVTSGEKATVASGKDFSISPVSTHGADWEWVEQLSPGFVMDGRSMDEFLTWVAHETGRKIVYSTGNAQRLATGSQLRGSVDFPPLRALELVMTTSDLDWEIEGGEIQISLTD